MVSNTHATISSIRRTRTFNLLMDLKSLYTVEKMACYQELAIKLLELLQANLTNFQSVMMDDPLFTDNRSVYPATEKIRTLYQVLTAVLPETCSFSEIAEDLDRITALYEQDAVIPFRDATPKNILLEIPALFQLRFASYEERLATVKTLCLSGALNRLLDKEKVYQIDFSGCKFLCPLDDDWIALQDHESSAWLSLAEKSRHNRKDVSGLCTRFVRFSRFGGRKLAYRLLSHKGYNIRFVHDNEAIYFYSLIDICRSLKDHHIIRSDRLGNLMTDLHRMSGFTPEKDYLQAISPVNNRSVYYSDVFPG